jgi:hypothetical protein
MIPLWVNPSQGVPLNAPAEVLKLGDSRAAENLAAVALALHVDDAKRYQPCDLPGVGHVTWCNIFAADWCSILKAPLPHVLNGKEMRANDIYDALTAKPSRYPGWSETGTIASALAVKNLAKVGVPQVAVWKNPVAGHPGHIVAIIDKPAGKVDKPGASGIWVAAAGSHCSSGCPIEDQYPLSYLKDTKFFAWTGK